MAEAPVTTTIGQDFAERFAGSLAMYERSRQVIPGGITHDGRHMKPFPPYIANAQGAYKWDVDGNRLIDYVMGHGSLLFGHNDPEILAAMQAQLPRGTHYGAGHELEVRWAEEVSRLVPSAEQVKFTGSGTESTLLAIRVARSFTGRPTVLKLEGHFHGWHDYLLKGERPPFEASSSPGIPPEVMATVAVVPSDDLGMLEERLTQGDVAALILEPSGGSWATIPLIEGYLQAARDLTTKYGVVLIFDEVITGFRWAPGGAQQRYGVIPDLTTMAKIVAGGMPGGAVAGKREIMEMLAFKDEPGWNATKKVRHQGTYNASPVVSAAGITCCKRRRPACRCDVAARLRGDEEGAASGHVQRQPGRLGGGDHLSAKGGGPGRASHLRRPRRAPALRVQRGDRRARRARLSPGAKARSSTQRGEKKRAREPYRIRPAATCACPRASRPRL